MLGASARCFMLENMGNHSFIPKVGESLEATDLVKLSKVNKTLSNTADIWKTLGERYHFVAPLSKERVITFLNTPVDLNVHHLLLGEKKRAITKIAYKILPGYKLKKIGDITDLKQEMQRDHCIFVLHAGFIIPDYHVFESALPPIEITKTSNEKSAPAVPWVNKFYQLPAGSESLCPSKLGLAIYSEILNQAIRKEIGPFGFFSISDGAKWRDLSTLEFFRENKELSENTEIGTIESRSVLMITDIRGTEEDQNKFLTEVQNHLSLPFG
jgi:hypothetical protein